MDCSITLHSAFYIYKLKYNVLLPSMLRLWGLLYQTKISWFGFWLTESIGLNPDPASFPKIDTSIHTNFLVSILLLSHLVNEPISSTLNWIFQDCSCYWQTNMQNQQLIEMQGLLLLYSFFETKHDTLIMNKENAVICLTGSFISSMIRTLICLFSGFQEKVFETVRRFYHL